MKRTIVARRVPASILLLFLAGCCSGTKGGFNLNAQQYIETATREKLSGCAFGVEAAKPYSVAEHWLAVSKNREKGEEYICREMERAGLIDREAKTSSTIICAVTEAKDESIEPLNPIYIPWVNSCSWKIRVKVRLKCSVDRPHWKHEGLYVAVAAIPPGYYGKGRMDAIQAANAMALEEAMRDVIPLLAEHLK